MLSPQFVDELPVETVRFLRTLRFQEFKNQSREVKTVPLILQGKINALQSDGFRLFVPGFTCSGGKKIKARSVTC